MVLKYKLMECLMITIGICDNDSVFSENLHNMIRHALYPAVDWDIRFFRQSSEIRDAIESGTFHCDLLFMDVMIDGGSGLNLAQYISSHAPGTDLIFVTASDRHVYECYHYHAFAYLLKPVTEKDITSELQRYLQEDRYTEKCLTINYQRMTHRIPLNSILYIESNLRKVEIHTPHRIFLCYQKLNDLAGQLRNDGFVRCHQSYLFPLGKVTNYSNTHVYIQNIRLPISKRYQDEVTELLAHSLSIADKQTPFDWHQEECGALICIHGAYLGSIVRIRPEQDITIGRDADVADMVVNLPLVSRNHCVLTYHCDIMKYEVVDFSSNGTFIDGNKRLVKNESYFLKPGSEICFGDRDTIYKLG